MRTNWNFDERQLQIIGKVYYRGFIIALLLLLANGILQIQGIVWAQAYAQTLIIMVLIQTIVSVDAIFRGVYFGKKRVVRWLIISTYAITSLFLWSFGIWSLSSNSMLCDCNMLTITGFIIVIATLLTITTTAGIINEVMENRKKDE
ncbi:MAG: hypothetical protein FWC89_07790 [Defluviitaleaceae bacterium]|nr:hypothetical protein [Defluviitaleaceae bacterium]